MTAAETDLHFSAAEMRVLNIVLDEIIPPSADGRMPGAGALGVARYIEKTLQRSPELKPVIVEGLAAADELARRHHGNELSQLAKDQRLDVLQRLESSLPGFLSSLVFPTYLGYYQQPEVSEALGLGAHPPHPQGYEMEPNDLTLLEPVRRRGKLYRDC